MRLIDADALKENMVRECRNIGEAMGVTMPVLAFTHVIDDVPTVDTTFKVVVAYDCGQKSVEERSKGEWIAISERLPVHRDWYLGTFREPDTGFIGLPFICDYVGKVTKGTTKEGWILRGFTDIDNACDYYKSLECIAWQPLPEPYERGEL